MILHLISYNTAREIYLARLVVILSSVVWKPMGRPGFYKILQNLRILRIYEFAKKLRICGF
jgi:hypothetical protein